MDVMLFCWTRGDVDTLPAKKTEMIRQILYQFDGSRPRAANQKILPWRWRTLPTCSITNRAAASTGAPPALDPPPASN